VGVVAKPSQNHVKQAETSVLTGGGTDVQRLGSRRAPMKATRRLPVLSRSAAH
jgi:hypothetical protein